MALKDDSEDAKAVLQRRWVTTKPRPKTKKGKVTEETKIEDQSDGEWIEWLAPSERVAYLIQLHNSVTSSACLSRRLMRARYQNERIYFPKIRWVVDRLTN